MTNPWTAETEARLRQLAAEGNSASQIAAALNREFPKPFYITFTRNSVIGKCRRLGLELKGAATAEERSRHAKAAAQRRWADPANRIAHSEATRRGIARSKGRAP